MTTNSCEFFTLYEDKIIESRNGVAILQKNLDKKINLLKSFFYKKTKGELILSPKISEDNIQYNLNGKIGQKKRLHHDLKIIIKSKDFQDSYKEALFLISELLFLCKLLSIDIVSEDFQFNITGMTTISPTPPLNIKSELDNVIFKINYIIPVKDYIEISENSIVVTPQTNADTPLSKNKFLDYFKSFIN
jgi:hypothetical protein